MEKNLETLKMVCYVDFYDHKNNHNLARKDFESFEKAWEWIIETFDTPNKDFIHYY